MPTKTEDILTPRTITFNKSNWSGEVITVKLEKGGEFTLFDERFALVDTTNECGNMDAEDSEWFMRQFKCYGLGAYRSEYALCRVEKFNRDKVWETAGAVVSRDDADPVVAVIQTLCNIL